MKALTLTQPWATLVALGAKRIETRSWSTKYRGPLLIHAAAGLGPVGGKRGLRELIEQQPFNAALCDVGSNGMIDWWGKDIVDVLPLGAIVAVCNLVECDETDPDVWPGPGRYVYGNRNNPDFRFDLDWPVGEPERSFGDYSPGRYMWFLTNIRALPEPMPARGALGLWDYTGELPL